MKSICVCCEKVLEKFNWLPGLLSRWTIAGVFIFTGWGKLHNLPKVIEFFQSLGVPAANIQAPIIATLELVCGSLIFLGLGTRIAALPLIGIMTVAIWTAKRDTIEIWNDLFSLSEYLYIPILVWLIFQGPGSLSLDHFICKTKKQ